MDETRVIDILTTKGKYHQTKIGTFFKRNPRATFAAGYDQKMRLWVGTDHPVEMRVPLEDFQERASVWIVDRTGPYPLIVSGAETPFLESLAEKTINEWNAES